MKAKWQQHGRDSCSCDLDNVGLISTSGLEGGAEGGAAAAHMPLVGLPARQASPQAEESDAPRGLTQSQQRAEGLLRWVRLMPGM